MHTSQGPASTVIRDIALWIVSCQSMLGEFALTERTSEKPSIIRAFVQRYPPCARDARFGELQSKHLGSWNWHDKASTPFTNHRHLRRDFIA